MEKKFVKKPVVITAYQTDVEKEIETLEGTMKASPGDWIITGVNGEKYPCKPDIFEQTYSSVGNDESEQLLSPGMRFYCAHADENYFVVKTTDNLAFFCPERMDILRYMSKRIKVSDMEAEWNCEYMGNVEFVKSLDGMFRTCKVEGIAEPFPERLRRAINDSK